LKMATSQLADPCIFK